MKLATKTEPNKRKLDILWNLGWRHLEIWTDYSVIESPGTYTLLSKYDFEYAVHAPTDYLNMTVIDFADSIGAKVINTHRIVSNEELRALTEYAWKKDIIITVENESYPIGHHRTRDGRVLVEDYDPLCSLGDYVRLKKEVPLIRQCIDVEHATIRCEWPNILTDETNGLLGHIHICGYQGEEHHLPVYHNRHLFGDVVRRLKAAHYSGFVVCEHDAKFHTEEIWKKTLEDCKPLFRD